MATGSTRASAKPATPAGKALSARHLRENVAFNNAHAADHTKQAASDKKQLKALVKTNKKDAKAKVKSAKK